MEFIQKEINEMLNRELSATEVKKEDDFYFVGPFWIIGQSVEEINKGNFEF